MRNFSKEVLEIIKRLPNYIKLLYKVYRQGELKRTQKLLLYGAITYVVSPVDLIPGFIPVLGQADDMAVVLIALYNIISSNKNSKFDTLLSECKLSREILQHDLNAIKDYAKILGISVAKIALWGIKSSGIKGTKLIGNQMKTLAIKSLGLMKK